MTKSRPNGRALPELVTHENWPFPSGLTLQMRSEFMLSIQKESSFSSIKTKIARPHSEPGSAYGTPPPCASSLCGATPKWRGGRQEPLPPRRPSSREIGRRAATRPVAVPPGPAPRPGSGPRRRRCPPGSTCPPPASAPRRSVAPRPGLLSGLPSGL